MARPLSEVCQIRPPKAEVRRRLRDDDLVSFMPMEDLGISQKFAIPSRTKPLNEVVGSYTYFGEGDVLLAKITPCFENGKLGIAKCLSNGVGFGSSEYIVFRPTRIIDAGWLYYFLSRASFRREGEARMGGAVGHRRVALDFIDAYPIPVPPLPEQKRVVAILDEAFAGIDAAITNTERNIENAGEMAASSLSLILAHEANAREITLEEAVSADCSLSYGVVQPGDDIPGGLPIVRPTDLGSRIITLDGLKRIDPALASGYSRTTLQGGDLLLCVRGSTGVISQAADELAGANVTRGIVPIRFKPNVLNQDLGYFLLRSAEVQKVILHKTYGAALMQINIRDVRKIPLRVPRMERQAALLAKMQEAVSNGEALVDVYERKHAALTALKQSILHRAFAGDLTATPDRLIEASVA